MEKLQICVIGGGNHANRFIYPALANLEDVELVAVATRHAATAAATAKRHGALRSYGEYRAMLDGEKPDGVVIVGPPELHYLAGLDCIKRQIPFFCEKPSGIDAAQAAELAVAAEAAGTFGQVGFMMRHAAIATELAKLNDGCGGLVYGTVDYLTSGPYRSDQIYGMPGVDDASYLHRYLLVQAVHPVNFATAFLGEVTRIESQVQFSGPEDLVVEIHLGDAAGRRFRVLLHTLVAPHYGNLRFQGEFFFADRTMAFSDGFDRLEWNLSEPSGHANLRAWRFAPFGNANLKMGYESELHYFCDSVRSGRQPAKLTTLADSMLTMNILAAVERQFAGEK